MGGENPAEATNVAADTNQGRNLTGLTGQRSVSYSVVKKGGVQTARPQVGMAELPVQHSRRRPSAKHRLASQESFSQTPSW